MSHARDIQRCTGCRMGCRIDRYQCGRGEQLHELWVAGQSLPDVKLELSPEAQIARMLPRVARALGEALDAWDARCRALSFLAEHGGYASRRMLAYRAGSPEVVDALVADGLAREDAGFVRITDEGTARERELRESLDRACADFCAPLDEPDRQQLVDFLFKLKSKA